MRAWTVVLGALLLGGSTACGGTEGPGIGDPAVNDPDGGEVADAGGENPGPDSGVPIGPCDEFDQQFATRDATFDLAPAMGAFTYPEGVQTALEVGFDEEAEVMDYENDFKRIQLYHATLGGITVEWPQTISSFGLNEVIRVQRSADWLILRSKNNHYAALHTSMGTGLHRELEALPENGPVLRPIEQCQMIPDNGCELTAIGLEGRSGDEVKVIKAGWGGSFENDAFTIWNRGVLRKGNCGVGGAAQVIDVLALLWKR